MNQHLTLVLKDAANQKSVGNVDPQCADLRGTVRASARCGHNFEKCGHCYDEDGCQCVVQHDGPDEQYRRLQCKKIQASGCNSSLADILWVDIPHTGQPKLLHWQQSVAGASCV